MRRHLVLIGVVSFALLLFALMGAALASPDPALLLQTTEESEPNDGFSTANYVASPGSVTGVLSNTNQGNVDTQDCFSTTNTIVGRQYRVSLSVPQNPGSMSLQLHLYDGDQHLIDDSVHSPSYASITWTAYQDFHYFLVQAFQVQTDTVLLANYRLDIDELASTPTPTPTSTPLPGTAVPTLTPPPIAGLDSCENNSSLDTACIIAANQSRVFNLISPFGSGPDNDFYRIWIKPGLLVECRTSNLSPGVDPNMIVYDSNRRALGGNDDVSPGDYNSAFSYLSTYKGWLYLLVGTGDRTPSDLANSDYTLRCDVHTPGFGTPTIVSGGTNTPMPAAAVTATPVSNGTVPPVQSLIVRALTTPVPARAQTPAPRFVPISLLVYYDANNDGQPGAGEGIAGVSSRAYEAVTNQFLAQGFTEEAGSLEFTVSAHGSVRIDVPFFGFSQLVTGDGASIYLRVPPNVSLAGIR